GRDLEAVVGRAAGDQPLRARRLALRPRRGGAAGLAAPCRRREGRAHAGDPRRRRRVADGDDDGAAAMLAGPIHEDRARGRAVAKGWMVGLALVTNERIEGAPRRAYTPGWSGSRHCSAPKLTTPTWSGVAPCVNSGPPLSPKHASVVAVLAQTSSAAT